MLEMFAIKSIVSIEYSVFVFPKRKIRPRKSLSVLTGVAIKVFLETSFKKQSQGELFSLPETESSS